MSQHEQHDTREGMVYQQKRDGRWVARLTWADGTHKQVYYSTSEEAIQSLQMLLCHTGQSRDDLYLHPPYRQGQLLSAEQARRLLKVARHESPDIELLLTLALSTSIRRGELLALQWDDIDLESRLIQIRRSVNWLNSTLYAFSAPKTPNWRELLLPLPLIEQLQQRWIEQQRRGTNWRERTWKWACLLR